MTFRAEVRAWLRDSLTGEFAEARGLGGPGREHEAFDLRLAWERHLAAAGWTCLGWPEEHGGRGASVAEQVAFHEEYALARAPARVNHIGENLLGPTVIAFGTDEQRARFLPPMRQDGVEVRPIVQLTGTSEFNEVFFGDAVTGAADIVGAPGDGWRIAMATLGFERGVATLGQQVGFRHELEAVIEAARRTGAIDDPLLRDRLVRSWIGLRVMRLNAIRIMRGEPGPESSISKLVWGMWHRELGELAMDVLGAAGMIADGPPYKLSDAQRLYLFSRADTIYAGSNEIQRGIIAERVLGLPREARP